MARYIRRLVDPDLDWLMSQFAAVMIVGPRACGKTTTAGGHTVGRLSLDRPRQAAAVRADVDEALSDGPFPLLIDEWQLVPDVLGAVKRAVDAESTPGKFVLTGSARADLESIGWPATGRVVRRSMTGLVERELEGTVDATGLVGQLLDGGIDDLRPPPTEFGLRDYVERALRSGFPEAIDLSPRARTEFLGSYLDHLVGRDIPTSEGRRDPVRLRRFLSVLAANTAGTPTRHTLADASQLVRSTARSYESAVESLMVAEALPAWSSNRLSRLAALPKRYFLDAALAASALGVDARAVVRDGDLLGRLLDTFVASQVRAEAAVSIHRPTMYHLRDANGRREIDLLLETPAGQVLAIEVKSDSAPGIEAARHLRWLRDGIGDRFLGGVVFHTGPRRIPWEPGIVGLPIAAFWTI